MIGLINITVFSMLCCVVLADFSKDYVSDNDVSGKRHHKHKHHFPYKVLLFHYAHGAIIALVIIKIVLAMTLVGMITAMIKMFAAIKFLFQDTNKSKEASKIVVPQYHHSHEFEYDFPGHLDYDGYKYVQRRREETLKNRYAPDYRYGLGQRYYFRGSTKQDYLNSFEDDYYRNTPRIDLKGGRSLGSDAAYYVQLKENKERRKRELEHQLNFEDGVEKDRTKRSDEEADENCMKRRVCLLHARAGKNPLFTFQLFFIKKDGLAQYWDHDDTKTEQDCVNAFPCHKGGVEKEPEKEKKEDFKTTQKPADTEKGEDMDSTDEQSASTSVEDDDSDETSQGDNEVKMDDDS